MDQTQLPLSCAHDASGTLPDSISSLKVVFKPYQWRVRPTWRPESPDRRQRGQLEKNSMHMMPPHHSLLLMKVTTPPLPPTDEARCQRFWRLGTNLQQAYSSRIAAIVTCLIGHRRWGLASTPVADRQSDASLKHSTRSAWSILKNGLVSRSCSWVDPKPSRPVANCIATDHANALKWQQTSPHACRTAEAPGWPVIDRACLWPSPYGHIWHSGAKNPSTPSSLPNFSSDDSRQSYGGTSAAERSCPSFMHLPVEVTVAP